MKTQAETEGPEPPHLASHYKAQATKQLTLSDIPSVQFHKLFCAWDPHEGVLLIVLQRTQEVRTPKNCFMLGSSGVCKTSVPKAAAEIL